MSSNARDDSSAIASQIVGPGFVTPAANFILPKAASSVAGPPDASGFSPPAELFQRSDGKDEWTNFFAPIALRLQSGVLLVIAEARSGVSDRSTFDFVARRSLDNGATWSPMFLAHHDANNINLGSLVQDKETGRVFLLYAINSSDIAVISSSDDGLNWSKPSNITADVKITQGFDSWGFYAPGPAPGIQLEHGAFAGRMIVTANHRHGFDRAQPSYTNTIYSDDHGTTWHRGGGLAETIPNFMTNEATIVERNNGELYLNMRVARSGDARRAYSVSADGGATWTDAVRDSSLTVPTVQGSLLRVNENLILFGAPSNSVDAIRREYTIWASTDDAHSWTRKKTLFFDRASYSSLAIAGPNTILATYNRSHQLDSGGDLQQIGYSIIDLDWLNSSAPDQFIYYFAEKQNGESAVLGSTTIFDFGPFDNRLQPESTDLPPTYVSGRNGDSAISLSAGPDNILLANAASGALRFNADKSFAIEALVRLQSSNGAIIGADPNYASFELQVIDGKLAFSLTDVTTTAVAQGSTAINDAAWHRIAAVRDAATKTLRVYIDGQLDATTSYAFEGVLQSDTDYTIGSRPDLSKQLAVDVDTLRVTRALLSPEQFMPIDAIGPGYRKPPAPPAGAPNSIPGLQLWVGAGDYAPLFSRPDFATPLSAANSTGAIAQSGFELSENSRQVWTRNPSHLAFDSRAGYYLTMNGTFTEPPGWYVRNDDPGPGPFDFVQNTGKFTLATTFKLDSLNQDATLFDNINLTTQTPGFSLLIGRFGAPTLYISDSVSPARLIESFAAAKVSVNVWYQIVVVGNGPGNPVTLYLTPLTDDSANAYTGISPIVGADGNYPASKARVLMMGSRAATVGSTVNGGMTDMLIYDRPLTPAEVQKLLDFSRRPQTPQPHGPIIEPAFTNENTQTVKPIIINRHPADGDEVTHFRISGMYGGTVQLADGVTQVQNGQFITLAQGLAGLRFTPSPGFLGEANFTVQSSVGDSLAGLGFDSTLAIVQVGPPNLPPSFQVAGPMWVLEDSPRNTIANFATNISPGGPGESGQTVSFQITTDNPSLFSEQPAISANGTLTFQTAPNANGVANLSIIARDDGGVASGGSDTSAVVTSRIIAIPVNDPPQFKPGRDVMAPAGGAAQSITHWSAVISAGPPDEVTQVVAFEINNDRPDLFDVQPQLSPDGTLTFRPTVTARGVAHLTLVAKDNGGDINGGIDQSFPVTFAIGIGQVLSIAGTPDDDAYRIVRNINSFLIYRNADPTPIRQGLISDWIGLTIDGLEGKDSLTVDLIGGNPLPPLVRFDGGNGLDAVSFVGTGSESIGISSTVATAAANSPGEANLEFATSRIQSSALESLGAIGLAEVSYRSQQQGNEFNITTASTASKIVAPGATLPLSFSSIGALRIGGPDSGSRQAPDEITVSGNFPVAAGQLVAETGLAGDFIAVDAPFASVAWPATASLSLIVFRGVAALDRSQQLDSLVLSGGGLVLSGKSQTVSAKSASVNVSTMVTVGQGNHFVVGDDGLSLSDHVHLTKAGPGKISINAIDSIGQDAWLDVLTGSARLLADGGANFNLSTAAQLELAHAQNLASLIIRDGGTARVVQHGSTLLSTKSLTIEPQGQLDLTDNGLRVQSSGNTESVAKLNGYLRAGRNDGRWNGLGGIASSIANVDHELLTGVNGQLNNVGLGDMLTSHLFGVAVLPTDFIARFTYSGDIDLNGVVDSQDYELINLSYADATHTYFAGDLDLDGKIDGTDYAILDNSFNFQGKPLSNGVHVGAAPLAAANGVAPVAIDPTATQPTFSGANPNTDPGDDSISLVASFPAGLLGTAVPVASIDKRQWQDTIHVDSDASPGLPLGQLDAGKALNFSPSPIDSPPVAHLRPQSSPPSGVDAQYDAADLLDSQLVELLARWANANRRSL